MLSVRLPLFALFFVASAGANAAAPLACTSDDQCAAGEFCALSDCAEPCNPDEETCEPTDCGGGICVVRDTEPAPASCLDDSDCATGQLCLLSDCGPSCDPDDEACEPTDCGGAGICVDEEIPFVECVADSDCSDGDICISTTTETCSGGGSDPGRGGEDAAPPRDPPTECKVETYAYCGPRWYDDCEVASDCGPGFTCEFLSQSDCACTAPDEDPTTDECACEETPATEGVCVLELVVCTDDAGCADDFVCIFEGEVGVGCNEAGGGDCGAEDNAERDPALVADGYCAPVGFEGPREDENEAGETPTTIGEGEGEGEDAVDSVDEDDDVPNPYLFACAASNAGPAGLLPFAALALVLRRRRR